MIAQRFSRESAWIEAARALFTEAVEAARARGADRLRLCLAGGTTPEAVYRALAALPLRGLAIELWPGDEREVAADSPERNGALIARAFAGAAWSPRPLVRLWPLAEAATAARLFAESLRREGFIADCSRPFFDLSFLGIGGDGHTAGLFPATPESADPYEPLALPSLAPAPPQRRMSLGYGALASSRQLAFLLKGEGKRGVAERVEAWGKGEAGGGWSAGDAGWPSLRLAALARAGGARLSLLYSET